MSDQKKKLRGFGAMDKEKLREIASRGGKMAHQMGRAHRFSPAEASAAGKRGGFITSRDSEHMSNIGRLGGMRSGKNARKNHK